jgi:RNA polymerase sigma-70 factor, ECF subfamily
VATSPQEAQWVLQAQCGDREALEFLLRSIQPALHRYLMGIVGGTHTDDVMQETLMIICHKLGWLHSPELFRPWSYRVASRVAFRHLKKEKRWPLQAPDESIFEQLRAADPPPSSELLQELLNSEAVSPASRAVLALHFQEELSLAEVAAVLEIPLGTVKSRLAYGLDAIRKQFSNKRRNT